jgi:hypothetical protein
MTTYLERFPKKLGYRYIIFHYQNIHDLTS